MGFWVKKKKKTFVAGFLENQTTHHLIFFIFKTIRVDDMSYTPDGTKRKKSLIGLT
jgi:hypothetical protein